MPLPSPGSGKGSALAPHDVVSIDILAELVKRAKQGEPVDRRVLQWINIVKQAANLQEANDALIRATAVSDDVFDRWLQFLDGRKVVVILDICFAGGFAAAGQQDANAGKGIEFRLFEDGMSRLKAIGQKDCALLAACGAEQVSTIRAEKDLSVMTYYLDEILRQARGPLELGQTHQYCREHMRDYFSKTNAALRAKGKPPLQGHEPRLFNYCTGPVYLKP
jgi:hypothetical protein